MANQTRNIPPGAARIGTIPPQMQYPAPQEITNRYTSLRELERKEALVQCLRGGSGGGNVGHPIGVVAKGLRAYTAHRKNRELEKAEKANTELRQSDMQAIANALRTGEKPGYEGRQAQRNEGISVLLREDQQPMMNLTHPDAQDLWLKHAMAKELKEPKERRTGKDIAGHLRYLDDSSRAFPNVATPPPSAPSGYERKDGQLSAIAGGPAAQPNLPQGYEWDSLKGEASRIAGLPPEKRNIITGADDFKYYEDTGDRVLPKVIASPKNSGTPAAPTPIDMQRVRDLISGDPSFKGMDNLKEFHLAVGSRAEEIAKQDNLGSYNAIQQAISELGKQVEGGEESNSLFGWNLNPFNDTPSHFNPDFNEGMSEPLGAGPLDPGAGDSVGINSQAGQTDDVQQKFNSDPSMKGNLLGKLVDGQYEVMKNGKRIGWY